ncbi:MAG: MarR family transcriptional regulator [Candidatus Bathyarchaeia archaeon]|nr:MarR family transcriptional regulator [Candidatus Bathyarchaeia archaeon]
MSSLFNLNELKNSGGFKAGDLLAVDPKLYSKFLRHLSRTVRRDVVTKNMVFLTALSAYTPEPLNLFLRGEPSIGKSYNVVQTLSYFPEGDVWLLGRLSPTALVHQRGILVDKNNEPILPFQRPSKDASPEEKELWLQRLRESRYLIQLSGKILVFLEAPHLETFNMLRPILSHDAYQISYRFTEKTSKGQLQTQHVIIQGFPATIFCSASESYVQDLATRGFTITPEMTTQKYSAANILTGKKSAFPWLFQPDSDYDFMLLKGYIQFLKTRLSELKVVDPYAMKFAQNFPSRSSRSMRDFKHLTNLLKVYALFHFAQRPLVVRKVRLEVEGEQVKEIQEHYIMVTKRDYEFILALWQSIQETTETSAPGHILKFFHEVVEEVANEKDEFTIEDLTERWNSKFEDKKSSYTIRRWVAFFCEIGYLTDKEDPTDKRRYLYKVTQNSKKTCKYVNLQKYNIFEPETLKAWLKETEKIFANNPLALIYNMVTMREVTFDELYNSYYNNIYKISQRANICLSQNKTDSSESASKLSEFEKCTYLHDFKAVYWSDSFHDWHQCAVCGQTKLTSWQAETFKGEKLWICEDCKLEWEKRREVS